ncbi:hypothetical protein KFE94_14855 [bacterium SCSIO 12643]|nr:hypothetical protein KFE94_14855 [bacterium SCSIO 12643]
MAFTEGQLYFAIAFFIAFVIVMIFAYRSDIKNLGVHSKGALSVLGVIVLVMIIFYATVKLLAS